MPTFINGKRTSESIRGPAPAAPGVGDHFAQLVKKLQWLAKKNCCCDPLRRLMNIMGPDWCRANVGSLAREVRENTYAPVPSLIIEKVILVACEKADNM